jgi:hypothetical protein
MAHTNAYFNGLVFENFLWKGRYNDLWNSYQSTLNENIRLTNLISEFENRQDFIEESEDDIEKIEETEEEIQPNNISNPILYLQNKNRELLQKLLKKTQEINVLRRNLPNSPPLQPPKPPIIPNISIIPTKK